MEAFRADGHLTDEALSALAGDAVFDELTRLEIAEHLAFCDECLQRYTGLLETVPLLVPAHSCRKRLLLRIRARTLQLLTSRYTTAAAAVALALTLLWGGQGIERVRPALPEDRPSVSRQLSGLTGEWSDSLRETAGGLSEFFNGLWSGHSDLSQGGSNS